MPRNSSVFLEIGSPVDEVGDWAANGGDGGAAVGESAFGGAMLVVANMGRAAVGVTEVGGDTFRVDTSGRATVENAIVSEAFFDEPAVGEATFGIVTSEEAVFGVTSCAVASVGEDLLGEVFVDSSIWLFSEEATIKDEEVVDFSENGAAFKGAIAISASNGEVTAVVNFVGETSS